ncbi:hypothetical protein ASPZODRAFT_66216 [Penicilliopsis zonata CBS 506.65]|uniref:Chromosome segregation in meiosis protein n=1 Tax=Penicilliopsis zonata CBS 506.65 TaxID=1073090 RepID=A0A1L9SGV0_9EURO|nr:hypothetical protein ASPZODRAFT_66216 [Penicilliopsis zonata CBS 506.65]OJJ46336.1 hypothetical protein ASPZODRAFT_66216 [Penicilliopsis zonata CBS 506.65]
MALEVDSQSPAPYDDLFDYDITLDDIFKGSSNKENGNTSNSLALDNPELGLGLDEEVKVTKKRQPIAKLDEGRLLSQNGIPRLRRTAKSKLKLKGKGHEFSDAARILNFYQLWLDDLFPRAKFADGLAMIEKLGHSKRLQTMRREWIDEEKTNFSKDLPSSSSHLTTDSQIHDDMVISGLEQAGERSIDGHGLDAQESQERMQLDSSTMRESGSVPPHDELFLPQDHEAPQINEKQGRSADGKDHTQTGMDISAPDDDELDALLREQEDDLL